MTVTQSNSSQLAVQFLNQPSLLVACRMDDLLLQLYLCSTTLENSRAWNSWNTHTHILYIISKQYHHLQQVLVLYSLFVGTALYNTGALASAERHNQKISQQQWIHLLATVATVDCAVRTSSLLSQSKPSKQASSTKPNQTKPNQDAVTHPP